MSSQATQTPPQSKPPESPATPLPQGKPAAKPTAPVAKHPLEGKSEKDVLTVLSQETGKGYRGEKTAVGYNLPPGYPEHNPHLLSDLHATAREHRERTTAGIPLHQLHDTLKAKHPGMTLADFHRTLQQAHRDGYVRMSGWPGTLDDLKRPETAVPWSGKIMGYANVPHDGPQPPAPAKPPK